MRAPSVVTSVDERPRRVRVLLAAVRADDDLVERVRTGRVRAAADPLVCLLLAWRAEVNRLR